MRSGSYSWNRVISLRSGAVRLPYSHGDPSPKLGPGIQTQLCAAVLPARNVFVMSLDVPSLCTIYFCCRVRIGFKLNKFIWYKQRTRLAVSGIMFESHLFQGNMFHKWLFHRELFERKLILKEIWSNWKMWGAFNYHYN